MSADTVRRSLAALALLVLAEWAALWHGVALASEAVCAEVRIEIRQKLNLERQAFDAVLRIRNGLAESDIEALSVNVLSRTRLATRYRQVPIRTRLLLDSSSVSIRWKALTRLTAAGVWQPDRWAWPAG